MLSVVHHIIRGTTAGGLHRVVDVTTEHRKVLGESVSILGQETGLDALHEILEAVGHGFLLLHRLAGDDVVTQFVEVLLIQQYEAQQGARHGPLVPAVLKHDDVKYSGEHLL